MIFEMFDCFAFLGMSFRLEEADFIFVFVKINNAEKRNHWTNERANERMEAKNKQMTLGWTLS